MSEEKKFVSRAGEKLQAALDAFGVQVAGLVCADFGCNVGGFTDCLLQAGAAKVYAIDTGYGELAWKLRKDPRVIVMERTNALHCPVAAAVDLVVVDVAWTPQALVVPAAVRWLRQEQIAPAGDAPTNAAQDAVAPKPCGRILSLLKPHYELAKLQGRASHKPLTPQQSGEVCNAVCTNLQQGDVSVKAVMRSVLLGKGGNMEYILLLEVQR